MGAARGIWDARKWAPKSGRERMTGLRVLEVDSHAQEWPGLCDAFAVDGRPEILHVPSASAVTDRWLQLAKPHVGLVDVTLPGPAVVALMSMLVRQSPPVPVVALCETIDDARISFAVSAGARACVDRHDSSSQLARILREVSSGGFPLARDLAARPSLICQLVSELQHRLRADETGDTVPAAGPCPLTERELVILEMVADGNANKEAAVTLDIAERTVKNHLANIFDKLAARGRAHAVRLAMESRWICTGLPHAALSRSAGRGVAA